MAQKKSHIDKLKSEKSHLNTQNLELQQQYQILFQHYQQQQNEISDLKAQINRVETRETITPEEYKRIANQSDYKYVKPYHRKDGTPVSGYYRRRRNR